MTWKELLAQKRVAREPVTKREIADQWLLAERALADAMLDAPLSNEGRFDRAYDAVRTLATAVVRASGYRVKAIGGGHYNTFRALEVADPERFAGFAAYFDICRRKRNELNYEAPGVVSRTEVEELVREARRFRDLTDRWLRERHAGLL